MADDNLLKSALQEKFPDAEKKLEFEKLAGGTAENPLENGPRIETARQPKGARGAEPLPAEEGSGSGESVGMKLPVAQTAGIDARTKEIETVLEEGLIDFYKSMPPEMKTAFKQKGEETAYQINAILAKAKFSMAEIITAIRHWLEMIPGVNKFFLEQEAKIKADKIIDLAEK